MLSFFKLYLQTRSPLLQEAGIDMGGLMKEFLESVVSAGFDPNRGLFAATPDGQAYPNPVAGGPQWERAHAAVPLSALQCLEMPAARRRPGACLTLNPQGCAMLAPRSDGCMLFCSQ